MPTYNLVAPGWLPAGCQVLARCHFAHARVPFQRCALLYMQTESEHGDCCFQDIPEAVLLRLVQLLWQMKLMFDIGRKLLSSFVESPGFLSLGVIIACLRDAGTEPVCRLRFVNVVIAGTRMDAHFLIQLDISKPP